LVVWGLDIGHGRTPRIDAFEQEDVRGSSPGSSSGEAPLTDPFGHLGGQSVFCNARLAASGGDGKGEGGSLHTREDKANALHQGRCLVAVEARRVAAAAWLISCPLWGTLWYFTSGIRIDPSDPSAGCHIHEQLDAVSLLMVIPARYHDPFSARGKMAAQIVANVAALE
jgi:hypothetical protein